MQKGQGESIHTNQKRSARRKHSEHAHCCHHYEYCHFPREKCIERAQCFSQSLTVVGFTEACVTPELFFMGGRVGAQKRRRVMAPRSGCPSTLLPRGTCPSLLNNRSGGEAVQEQVCPAPLFSGEESRRPRRFLLICRLTKQRAQKGVRDFPGGPVVKTPHFHCRGCRFHPWSGN